MPVAGALCTTLDGRVAGDGVRPGITLVLVVERDRDLGLVAVHGDEGDPVRRSVPHRAEVGVQAGVQPDAGQILLRLGIDGQAGHVGVPRIARGEQVERDRLVGAHGHARAAGADEATDRRRPRRGREQQTAKSRSRRDGRAQTHRSPHGSPLTRRVQCRPSRATLEPPASPALTTSRLGRLRAHPPPRPSLGILAHAHIRAARSQPGRPRSRRDEGW